MKNHICFQGDQFEGGDLYFGSMAKAHRTVFSNFTCKKQKEKKNEIYFLYENLKEIENNPSELFLF